MIAAKLRRKKHATRTQTVKVESNATLMKKKDNGSLRLITLFKDDEHYDDENAIINSTAGVNNVLLKENQTLV